MDREDWQRCDPIVPLLDVKVVQEGQALSLAFFIVLGLGLGRGLGDEQRREYQRYRAQ